MPGRGRSSDGDVGVPPPPRVPSATAKELVFAYAGAQQAMVLIGGIFTLVGLGLALVFSVTLPVEVLLDLRGSRTVGVVTSAEIDLHAKINGRHPTDLGYRFELAGERYEGSSSTIDPKLRELQRGARVEVEYVSWNPGLSRVRGATYGFFGYFGLFPLIFAVIGLPLALLARRANQREIRAFTNGEAVLGRLLSFDLNRSVRINKRHPWELRWEYFVNGQRHTGALSNLTREKLEPFAVEQPVVLYDPAEPAVNTLWIP